MITAPDGSPQGPDLYNFYCSTNKASDLIANVLPAFKGRYLALFNELLSQVRAFCFISVIFNRKVQNLPLLLCIFSKRKGQ